MRRKSPPRDAEIEALRQRLFWCRRAVLAALAPEAREILDGHSKFEHAEEVWEWRKGVVDRVTGLAAPFSSGPNKARAYCPLCGEGTSSPYAVGFAYPDGLQRHLIGELAHECV